MEKRISLQKVRLNFMAVFIALAVMVTFGCQVNASQPDAENPSPIQNLSSGNDGDSFATAYQWGFGPVGIRSVSGSLDYAADINIYQFTAPITGTCTLYSSDITLDVKAWLYDASLTQIAVDDNSGGNGNFKIVVPLTEGQTYYLKVSHCDQSGTGSYTINVFMDDYGDTFTTAHEVTLAIGGNAIDGYTNFSGDVDMFKFTAPITGTYRFQTSPASQHTVTIYNASMQTVIACPSMVGMSGYTVLFNQELTQGQTYYLLIDKASQYRISITVPDDYSDTFDTAYPWGFSPVGIKTLNGNLEYAGDVDMIQFTAPMTGTYTIESINSTPDMKAWLYDSAKMQIAEDDNSGENGNFKIVASLTEGQTYYLKLSQGSQGGTGAYTIQFVMDDYGDTFTDAHEITLEEGTNTIGGWINSADDVDMFKFTAPTTGTYTFQTSPAPRHTVTIYDASMQTVVACPSKVGMAGYTVFFDQELTQGQTYYLMIDKASQYFINITVPN